MAWVCGALFILRRFFLVVESSQIPVEVNEPLLLLYTEESP